MKDSIPPTAREWIVKHMDAAKAKDPEEPYLRLSIQAIVDYLDTFYPPKQ